MTSARTHERRKAATLAGLHYVTDGFAGIRRRRSGAGWIYYAPNGARIRDPDTRKRLNALAIPPAWTDVWICPDPNGHIQATARDARGRKQYRYHPSYREMRDRSKFRRMLEFSEVLPILRERVERDLRADDLTRRQILATVVRLLDKTLIRVGKDEYARENRSFGLTDSASGARAGSSTPWPLLSPGSPVSSSSVRIYRGRNCSSTSTYPGSGKPCRRTT